MSKFYGVYRSPTLDCIGCGWKIQKDNEDWCVWGVGKRLSNELPVRRCNLLTRPRNIVIPENNWRVVLLDDDERKEMMRNGLLVGL